MLDLEVVSGPDDAATKIVSIVELGRHIRLSPSVANSALWQDILKSAVNDAVDSLDFPHGELNRTLMPRVYRRYLSSLPPGRNGVIKLPFPPLIDVLDISISDDSPPETVDKADYVVRKGGIIGEIEAKTFWPRVEQGPRAVAITYRAGYEEYPPALKRLVKFMAAHFVENSEATVLEQNKTLIDRKVLFAHDYLVKLLRVPVSYDDWC